MLNDLNAGRGVAMAISVAILTACGGGGGGSTTDPNSLSGTAFTGAALASASVSLKDSAGKNCANTTTGSNGSWNLTLENCGAAPYLIHVSGLQDGMAVRYFSAATAEDVATLTQSGTKVNVSQITDVIIKVALKTNDPGSANFASLTRDKLKTASADALNALVPADVMVAAGIDSTKDIRTMAVTPGSGVGLDKLHDRVPEIQVNLNGLELGFVARIVGYGTDGLSSATVGATVSTSGTSTTMTPKTGEIGGVEVKAAADVTPAAVLALPLKDRVRGEVMMMLANWDKVYATQVPQDGASGMQFTDACYLHDGQDNPYLLDLWTNDQANARAHNVYRVGAVRSNLTIASVTETSNADTSKTVTALVRYDIAYADGTKAIQAPNMLVFGNSKPNCTDLGIAGNGQNSNTWRFIGNGRQVETNALPVNALFVRRSLADGSSKGANTRSNRIEFGLYDYRAKGYTYAVITGPTLPASGIKMLFAATLRDATELQGKSGNYLNATGDNGSRICSFVNGQNVTQWDASLADCALRGGSGNFWEFGDATLNDTLPNNAVFTFNLYKDDGWKTVGGHLGRTPAAIYTDTLPSKPFNSTFAEANYPGLGFNVDDTVAMSAFLTAAKGAGGTVNLSLSNTKNLPLGAPAMGYSSLWMFSNGRKDLANSWPKYRQVTRLYPAASMGAIALPVLGKTASMARVDYAEIALSTTNRNGHIVRTFIYFD